MKEVLGIGISTKLEEVCTPSRLALLVYDMQVGIKSQIRQGDLIVSKVQRVLNATRAARVRVFFTRHMSLPKELMGGFQYRMAMAWQGVDDPEKVIPPFLRDTPGFEIVPELRPISRRSDL
jgi:biuret amidohydrolase